MAQVSVFIPQIGEGLQEARLVGFLKKAGEKVRRDEPIYQMETDKAVMDVESPYDGVIVRWTAAEDDILPIGGEVAIMEVAGQTNGEAARQTATQSNAGVKSDEETSQSGGRLSNISPRVRAYAKEKGLNDEQLASLAASGKKLMPEDIDDFVASSKVSIKGEFQESTIGPKQRLLSSRLVRSNSLVVPGTISTVVNWQSVENERARVKASGSSFQPSAFTMFSYCVVQALKNHPPFRSILVGEEKVRTFDHVNLGIAVALPGDELVIAAVPDADQLSWTDFAILMRQKIELARAGKDQISESVTVSLTNMQAHGLRDAVPVVVAPSVATIFLGEVYNGLDSHSFEIKMRRFVNVAMTFDHRLVNGVGAAKFLAEIKSKLESVSSQLVDL